MNFANNVILRDELGIFRSKKKVIDSVFEGLGAANDGE